MPINPLVVDNQEERIIFARAEGTILEWLLSNTEYNRIKKATAKNRLSQRPPTQDEADIIHHMYLEQRKYRLFYTSEAHLQNPTQIYRNQLM